MKPLLIALLIFLCGCEADHKKFMEFKKNSFQCMYYCQETGIKSDKCRELCLGDLAKE